MKYRCLYLRVESKPREFYSRLLYACKAAAQGWYSYFGTYDSVAAIGINKCSGIYYMLQAQSKEAKKNRQDYIDAGYKLVSMSEEGIIIYNEYEHCKLRYDADANKKYSRVFVTGHREYDMLTKYNVFNKNKMLIVGDMKFDMFTSKAKDVYARHVNAIKAKHGDFILFNSNISRYNLHYNYGDWIKRLKNKGVKLSDSALEYWKQLYEYLKKIHEEIIKYLPRIPSATGLKVIVRPHPTEDHALWRDWAKKHNNIKVEYSHCAPSWALASKGLIHTGCTTGLESYLLRKPSVSFRPCVDHPFDNNIANKIKPYATTGEELLSLATDMAKGKLINDMVATELKYHIDNNTLPTAIDNVVEHIGELEVKEHSLDDCLSVKQARKDMAYNTKNQRVKQMQMNGITQEEIDRAVKTWLNNGTITKQPIVKQMAGNLYGIYCD